MSIFKFRSFMFAIAIAFTAMSGTSAPAIGQKAPSLHPGDLVELAQVQQTRRRATARCHVHETLLCCPGGCIDLRSARRKSRFLARAHCHWHGPWVCCPGLGCVRPPKM